MKRSGRKTAFCVYKNCIQYKKPFITFMRPVKELLCPYCHKKALVEEERITTKGKESSFSEVQIHFNFDPISKKYKRTAIVRTPLIKGAKKIYYMPYLTDSDSKKALQFSRNILSQLQYKAIITISIDQPIEQFRTSLKRAFNRY